MRLLEVKFKMVGDFFPRKIYYRDIDHKNSYGLATKNSAQQIFQRHLWSNYLTPNHGDSSKSYSTKNIMWYKTKIIEKK